MPDGTRPVADATTTDLVKSAMQQATELIKLEIALAKDDVKTDVRQVRTAALSYGVAVAAAASALSMMLVALVLFLGAGPALALAIAGGLCAVAVAAFIMGNKALPRRVLDRTRERLATDVDQLKERVA